MGTIIGTPTQLFDLKVTLTTVLAVLGVLVVLLAGMSFVATAPASAAGQVTSQNINSRWGGATATCGQTRELAATIGHDSYYSAFSCTGFNTGGDASGAYYYIWRDGCQEGHFMHRWWNGSTWRANVTFYWWPNPLLCSPQPPR